MFTVNEKPKDGNCILEPVKGIALQDNFTVKCADWFDEDGDITYSIGESYFFSSSPIN